MVRRTKYSAYTEQDLAKDLKAVWPGSFRRLETRHARGWPDVFIAARFPDLGQITLGVELKIGYLTDRGLNHQPLDPEQGVWHRAWNRGGGLSGVLIGMRTSVLWLDGNLRPVVHARGLLPVTELDEPVTLLDWVRAAQQPDRGRLRMIHFTLGR